MKIKRITIISSVILFVAVILCGFFFSFNLSYINAYYLACDKVEDIIDCDESLQSFKGVNLLFFNLDNVKEKVQENPYLKVESISKKYPNCIELEVSERREVYFVDFSDKTYVVDQEGFVLCEKDLEKDYNMRDYIDLSFDGIEMVNLEIGSYIQSDDNDFFNLALSLAQEIELTDCVKSMSIQKSYDGENHLSVSFSVYSGVEIVVDKAEFKGIEKVNSAFKVYNDELNDFRKMSGKIVARNYDLNDDGYRIVWEG